MGKKNTWRRAGGGSKINREEEKRETPTPGRKFKTRRLCSGSSLISLKSDRIESNLCYKNHNVYTSSSYIMSDFEFESPTVEKKRLFVLFLGVAWVLPVENRVYLSY